MNVVQRIGPLMIVRLANDRPGALVGFKDACGDAYVVLSPTDCRALAKTLHGLGVLPL